MSLTDTEVKLIVAATAAMSAIVVAVSSAWIARAFVHRDRKRTMFAEAYRTALEWREMIYRLRRRDNTKETDRLITDRFHDLQERLDYYEGWIGSESRYMRRSYRKLVAASKSETLPLIQDAWNRRGKTGNADPNDTHPKSNSEIADAFLRDVRGHLSAQPWRWIAVMWRNRGDK